MQQKLSTTKRKKYKRLLKYFTHYLIMLILFSASINIFAKTNELIKIDFIEKKYFQNENIIINAKINKKHQDFYKFKRHPKLVIENGSFKLILSQTSTIPEGITIKNIYELKQSGDFTIKPKIISKKNTKKLKPIQLKINPPRLSEKTEFKWLITSYTNPTEIIDTIYADKKYVLILTGFFFNEDINNIIEVKATTPENSILEETTLENIFTYEEIKQIKKLHSKEKEINFIKAFFWTPIKNTLISLPEGTVRIKVSTLNNTQNTNKKINILPQKILALKNNISEKIIEPEEIIINETLKLAKKKNITKQTKNTTNISFLEKEKIAHEILKLRKLESQNFLNIFNTKLKMKRIELENKIEIYNSISPYSYFLKKIIAISIFIVLVLIIFFVILNINKKIKPILFIIFIFFIPATISTILYFNFFKNNIHKTALYIPKYEKNENNLYNIPEKNATIVEELSIGETIIIKNQTEKWFFVEKNNNIQGWHSKEDFLICD